MSIKDTIRLMFKQFFIICTSVTLAIGVMAYCLEGKDAHFSYHFPFQVLLSGIIGCIPTAVFHSKHELNRKELLIRYIIHFILLSTAILSIGYILRWYEDVETGCLTFSVILIVYAITVILSYSKNNKEAKDINEKLKKFNE